LPHSYFRTIGKAEYLSANYIEIVFLKVKSLKGLAMQGINAYFFDADVLFFDVPLLLNPSSSDILVQMVWR